MGNYSESSSLKAGGGYFCKFPIQTLFPDLSCSKETGMKMIGKVEGEPDPLNCWAPISRLWRDAKACLLRFRARAGPTIKERGNAKHQGTLRRERSSFDDLVKSCGTATSKCRLREKKCATVQAAAKLWHGVEETRTSKLRTSQCSKFSDLLSFFEYFSSASPSFSKLLLFLFKFLLDLERGAFLRPDAVNNTNKCRPQIRPVCWIITKICAKEWDKRSESGSTDFAKPKSQWFNKYCVKNVILQN